MSEVFHERPCDRVNFCRLAWLVSPASGANPLIFSYAAFNMYLAGVLAARLSERGAR